MILTTDDPCPICGGVLVPADDGEEDDELWCSECPNSFTGREAS